MSVIEKKLHTRSNSSCELCTSAESLKVYNIPPVPEKEEELDKSILVCNTCHSQIEDPEVMDSNHWRCLNDSMWSEYRAVKVVAWRMLSRLRKEGWPQDLLDMLYLEDDDLRFAKESGDHLEESEKIIHRDDSELNNKYGLN